jgi:hypothetical protein
MLLVVCLGPPAFVMLLVVCLACHAATGIRAEYSSACCGARKRPAPNRRGLTYLAHCCYS